MEFHEKLQQLRKDRGLTQEAVAEKLFVSRTAVSKWESGRGYPNIQTLKQLAELFSVTVDELLSGEELLAVAEKDSAQKQGRLRQRFFGLLDCSVAIFLVLPLFRQTVDGVVQSLPLWSLTQPALYLRIGYYIVVFGLLGFGILTLIPNVGDRWKCSASLLLGAMGLVLFVVSMQPYAAVFLFALMVIKVLLQRKKQ